MSIHRIGTIFLAAIIVATSASEDRSFQVNVLQLNTWLIPVRPDFPHCLDFQAQPRARRMTSWLTKHLKEKKIDVAIFQELWTPRSSLTARGVNVVFGGLSGLFGRHIIEKALRAIEFGYTNVVGSNTFSFSRRLLDSGLMIASRLPILEQAFTMYPMASTVDSFSSKGILVAALRRPDNTIVIVSSTHLDAEAPEELKIEQLGIAIEFVGEFTARVIKKFDIPIAARIFAGDLNIDGSKFWSDSNSYATARQLLEAKGFVDSWHLTSRSTPSAREILLGEFTPDSHPELGITSDQNNGSKRLDYIWAAASPGFTLKAETELNDGKEWRTDSEMHAKVEAAKEKWDAILSRMLALEADLLDRRTLISDHAALFAKLFFSPK